MSVELITSMDQLDTCPTCTGHGNVNAGSRSEDPCEDCQHTGWKDGTPHLCPHCDRNVVPMDPHTVYGQRVWHNECIREAMKDPNLSDLLFIRNDLAEMVAAFVAVKTAFDAHPMEPIYSLERQGFSQKFDYLAGELSLVAVRLNSLLKRMGED